MKLFTTKQSFIAIFLFFFATSFISGQKNADFALFWKYKEYPASRSFTVPGFLMKFASVFVKNKAEKRLVRSIGRTRIMLFEDSNPVSNKDLKRMVDRAEKGGLSTLMTVRDGNVRVHVLARERKGKIRKLVVIASEEDSFTLISMRVKLDLEALSDVLKKSE